MPEEDKQQPQANQPTMPEQPAQTPLTTQNVTNIKKIEKVTVWVMVLSAIGFGLISVLAIWGVFKNSSDNIVWKSLATLSVIAFAALIVNVGANMLESKKK